MKVALEKVERELAQMWEEEAKATSGSRVELLTIAALVSEPELMERAKAVLAYVATAHPCRTIAASWDSGTKPSIDCDVSLHRNTARANEACGDAIVLEAHGEARAWLPENLDRLALPDVPYCLWWVGDLPDNDTLFDEAVQHVDVVLVNSAEMDLRDLEKLSHIARGSKGKYALLDLTWIRLRGLQDLVARFFDDPSARAYLDGLSRIEIAYSPREHEQDAASTRVGLLIGWLAARLGLDEEGARWERDAHGGEITIPRRAVSSGKRPNAGPVTVRVNQEPREGVHPGSITRIKLTCDGPAGSGEGNFEIVRAADPHVVTWSIDAPGVALPAHTLLIGSHEESRLLASQLERPSRDPLFEASVYAAYRIVRPVAPRLSVPPPRMS